MPSLDFIVLKTMMCRTIVVKSRIPDILHLTEIDFVWKTCFMNSSKDGISHDPDLKIFWGEHAPIPSWEAVPSALTKLLAQNKAMAQVKPGRKEYTFRFQPLVGTIMLNFSFQVIIQ